MRRKILTIVMVAVMLIGAVCAAGMTSFADEEVVFYNAQTGKDTNDGKTAANAVKTIEAAYAKLPRGGKVVLASDLAIEGTFTAPKNTAKITLTSKHNGVEYGGKISNEATAYFVLEGETTFENITFEAKAASTVVANFNPVVFDKGVKVTGKDKSDLRVVGGYFSPKTTDLPIDLDSNITINDGDFYLVVGMSKNKGAGAYVHTGTSNITVNGGTVDILCGGTHANHAGHDLVFNMNGGHINDLRAAGDVSRRLYGSAVLNFNGGTVNSLNVNNVMGDAIVNINGTAPEDVKVSYYNDTLLQYAQKEGSQKYVYYNALICSKGLISKLNEYFDVVENTSCVYVAAGGKGNGLSISTPMGSVKKAYEMLREDGGKIIIDGEVACDLKVTGKDYSGEIIITGKDSTSALTFTKGYELTLESDTVFEGITLKAADELTVYGNCNNITFAKTAETSGNINIVGSAKGACKGDVSLTLNGGSFASVAGVGSGAGAFDGNVTVSLGGADAKSVTISKSSAAVIGRASLSVSGGKINDVVACDEGKVLGSMSLKMLGGEIDALTIKGAGGEVFLNVSHAKINSAIKAEGLSADKGKNTLILGPEVDAAVLANIKDMFGEAKNGNFVYVADGANGNGQSPDTPMSDLNAAVKALGGEGSIVICGVFTIAEDVKLDEYSYPVTITSIGADMDFRAGGAYINFAENLYLGGETAFENVNFRVGQSSTYIYANANKLVIGDEVSTELTNANTAYLNIVGGHNDKTTNRKTELVINSGDWGIVRAGSSATGLYESGVSINLTVNGGTFHRYVALSSRGNVSGTINFTANGGTFIQGIYAVYEEDGKSYSAKYDVTVTLNDGTFYQTIAPARSRTTKINGSYTVNVNGGEYCHLTDLKGTEQYSGGMTSKINIADSVDINAKETGNTTFQNPVDPNAPDPWIFYHDGYYYYTHTTGTKIILTKVVNIGEIGTSAETVVIKPTEGEDMWSPEIHYFSEEEVGAEDAGWYLFIAYDHGESGTRRAHVLKCKNGDDFFGDWVNPKTGEKNVPEKIVFPDYPELDSFGTNGGYSKLVVNGKTYVTFIRSVNRGTPEYHQMLCIVEMDKPWSYKGVPVTLAVPEYDWEMHGYGQDSSTGGWYPKVIEGASAVYGDNGEVYIMYTGSGYWTKYYQLGYMKYLGGDPLDPASWKKNPTSILSLSDEVNGCGHGSYFRDHNGDYYVAYHGYLGKDTSGSRWLFVEQIHVEKDRVWIGNDSGHPAPLATVYTVPVNPMPLAEKISGFTEDKKDDTFRPFGDGEDTAATTTEAVTDDVDKGGDMTLIIVVAVAAVVAVAVVAFVFVKKKSNAAK